MSKPATMDGYSDAYTLDCERVLVTLLRGLGPWKDSICLIGGLTPRYLVRTRPPAVPAHAGSQDVDIVIDLPFVHTRFGPRVRQRSSCPPNERSRRFRGEW